jgi:rod shape-determining protein MreC
MIPASLTLKAKDKAKQSPTFLLICLVVLHLIAISLNRVPGQPDLRYLNAVALTVAFPFQWAASHSVAVVKSTVTRYFYLRDKTAENEALKSRTAALETQLIEIGEKANRLEQQDAVKTSQPLSAYPRIAASVIGRDADTWFNSVVIDRGSLSGVARNQPVVTAEGGLIGRIIQTSPVSARVLLLTDERHGAGAVIAQTADGRRLGVLKGKNNALCSLNFSEPPEKLANGEAVITSGQDRLYPKGLLIGRVVNLSGTGSVPPTVDVSPSAPLGQLETVAVLKLSPEEIYHLYDELIKEEQLEKEKQEKSLDRKKR